MTTPIKKRKVVSKHFNRIHDLIQCDTAPCKWEIDGRDGGAEYLIKKHIRETGHTVHREIGRAIHYSLEN